VRVLLFTGKGGVGTTTVAAATAACAAARGHKTLVVSLGAPGSLGDVLGARLPAGGEPDEVDGGFYAQEIDARRGVERGWAALPGAVTDAPPGDDVPVLAAEAPALPGAAELLALLTIGDAVGGGRFDVVVVDCGPTPDALRLVALPEALTWYVDRLLPLEPSAVRTVAAVLARATGREVAPQRAFDGVERLRAELAATRTWLTDPATTSARLVVPPRGAGVAAAARALPALILHGARVDAAVVNRAGDDADLADIATALGGVPVRPAPDLGVDPVGPAALLALGDALYAGADPLSAGGAPEPVRVERTADAYDLVVALPLTDRADVDLARSGDDLVVTLGASRRVLPLPSALRRCVVTGAALADGELRVGFRPDPALWTRS
jgi:arsenite-transporting ATPase